MPVSYSQPQLIGTGAEKTVAHLLGRDFVSKAKEDGIVKIYDEKSAVMILEYKDGSHDAIDLSSKISFNGGKRPPLPPNTVKYCTNVF